MSEQPHTPLRLLMVEGSHDDGLLLLEALDEAGFAVEHQRVETAGQLQEALLCRVWDIVISDYRLPGFDGLKALEMVRRGGRDIPFIFVSGTLDDEISVQAMKAGANDSLAKGHLARLGSIVARELREVAHRSQTLVTKVQLRAILDSAQDAILVVDEQGRIQVFNRGAEDIFGYLAREMLGHNIGLLLPGSGHELLKRNLVQAKPPADLTCTRLYEGRYLVLEGRRKDGQALTLEASSSRAFAAGQATYTLILRDISRRLRAEQELSASRERLRSLLQTIPDPIWLKDPEGRFLSCNRRFEDLYGAAETELLGKTDYDFVDRETADFLRASDLAAMAVRRARTTEEEATFASDGHTEVLQTSKAPVYDARGDFIGVLGIARDITELKRAEQELEQHRSHLQELVEERTAELRAAREQAERLAQSKSEFLANMSHEIRTPMNAVLGLAYLLERQDLPEEARDLARKIHQSGRSLLSIINDILDFSKIESGKVELELTPFRLTQVLDNLATIMTTTARDKALELVIAPPAGVDGSLRGDPLRLGQVLINLTNNAIKFTEAGVVEVRIEAVERTDSWVRLRFEVRDTGIGIAPEVQARLFQPFSQADVSTTRRFGGSGLGLVISRRLVQLMGGLMGLESTLGEGSTFWIEIPFERADEEAEDRRSPIGMQVLVADDSPVVRDGLVATAAALGWLGHQAGSGEAALHRVLSDPALQGPDAAVLLDWCMPGRDGLATARAIREALPESRWPLLFILTAYPPEEVQESPGADLVEGVLAKPLAPSPLYDAVVRARGRRLEEAVAPKRAIQQAQRLAGLHLLVVDDSEINREVAQHIFAGEGASISLAADGQEALDWLRAHPDAADIVLMDVQMPVMDGHEATRRIRQSEGISGLPVVALTAGALRSQEASALEAGMDAFLSKPFDVEAAVATILRLCRSPLAGDSRAGDSVAARVARERAPTLGEATPVLPGLAIERGLAIWKDPETYRLYLRKLARDEGDAARRIAAAGPDEARRLAHALKGAAGNLGLTEVAAQCAELERLLASAGETQEAAEPIAALQSALDRALDSIARYAPDAPAGAEEAAAGARDTPDLARIEPHLREALEAFAGFDPMRAGPSLTQLAQWLPTEQLAPLREAIEDFDVSRGETAVRALAETLGIDLKEAI